MKNLQFIHTLTATDQKPQKSQKAILTTITLTFRRC